MKGVWQRTIVDNNGNVQAFASVEFRDEADNTLADIFSDKEGTASPGNPKTADAFGFLRVYLTPGVGHKITATKGAFSAEWRDEQVNPGIATVDDAGLMSVQDKTLLDLRGQYIRTQILTSGTSFTTHPAAAKIRYRMVGGGGGGGGAATAAVSCAAASGGGSGSYSEGWFIVTASSSYSYAIGALGAGGAAGANNGSNGGSTTLTVGATTVTCFGGTGGLAMAIGAAPSGRRGGLRGATSTNGDFNTPGNCGELSIRFSGTEGISGAGGVSALGSGAGQNLEVGAAGSSATANNTGAGGGGALVENGSAAVAGGNGSPGSIIIDEYT